jgi:hypothetical protein
MNKKATMKIVDETPITQTDIDSGKLILRTRGATGAVVPAK